MLLRKQKSHCPCTYLYFIYYVNIAFIFRILLVIGSCTMLEIKDLLEVARSAGKCWQVWPWPTFPFLWAAEHSGLELLERKGKVKTEAWSDAMCRNFEDWGWTVRRYFLTAVPTHDLGRLEKNFFLTGHKVHFDMSSSLKQNNFCKSSFSFALDLWESPPLLHHYIPGEEELFFRIVLEQLGAISVSQSVAIYWIWRCSKYSFCGVSF